MAQFTHLGFPSYFRVELCRAKLPGVVLPIAPAPMKEWAYAGFAVDLISAAIAHVAMGAGPEAWGRAAGTGVLGGVSCLYWRRPMSTALPAGRDLA